ncbi:MAG: strawberry notch family protein [Verrucomicrobiales bacterium]|nr:strawberry notch family protein [Verrucomicrobiales bacterium]
MTDLFEQAEDRLRAAIDDVAKDIACGTLTKSYLFAAMERLHGDTSANGAWTQRDAYDLLEAALTSHQLSQSICSLGQIAVLSKLVDAMPTHTVRSEDQIRYQQFSTPADLAALAALAGQPRASDIVLEPSAGHGALVSTLPPVAELHLNELDAGRRSKLSVLFPSATITGIDGAMLTSLAAHDLRPTLILMNPPFSRSQGRGVDEFAAVRHIRAGLAKLAQGGRLVAVMPDWFTTSAKMLRIYEETFANCTVQTSCRLARCYHKQGTSVAVRLYVVDKIPGSIKPSVLARNTVADLAAEFPLVKRASIQVAGRTPGLQSAKPKGATLFRAMRHKPRTAPAVQRTVASRAIVDIGYETLATPRALGTQAGVYVPYRPSRIEITGAAPHPTPLVESVAMGSIPAPVPEYVPQLHDRILERAHLSEAQIETVIYAGNAWLQFLPGKFKPSDEGVGLTLSEEGRSYRKGYFLGDGTGAGKGRQIAACILDNWLAGRRKAIWVSKNESLLEDARRDWSAIGGLPADIQPLSSWKIDEDLPFRDGIVFVTYPTLRSQRQDATRLKQLLDWAGDDYEGVIAFDESHEMGGVAGGEGARGAKAGSLQGIAGVLLQNHLPDARVLYASATGASDVNNLAYAVRLGLWGPGTAFSNREDFISQIRSGGIAAMELVSRDLKALGLYQARALSFAGVEYEVLKHDLTEAQIGIYDTYADAWAIIHQNMEEALALTNVVDDVEGGTLNSGAKAAARSRFEGAKQRFFNQVLLSMKLPTLIAAINSHLDEDKAIVVQLVSTAESILDRRLDSLSPEERAELDIDLSPRENVIDYLERAFPTQQMQVYVDDTGEERSMPMFDDDGRPVHNSEALQRRQALIEHLCGLPPIKPALDGIIEHYGTDRVAEVTGRTKRLVTQRDGSQQLETRSPRTNQSETDQFMDGRKKILVFSDAGGTGRSYHASLDAENQRQRVHFLLEPGWRADRAIQGLGRTHRTHQAETPLFRPVTTNCKGELRFTSTIARRLDSLGALTRGQRQTGGQNLFDPADNLESEYAKAALGTWFGLLAEGTLKSATLLDFQKRTGLKIASADGILEEDLPPIQRWLNRILALPIAMQNAIFEEFLALVEARVSAARDAGTLDVGVETIQVEAAAVAEDIVLKTDERTGATSHLLRLDLTTRYQPMSIERILERREWSDGCRFLRNGKSEKAALCEPSRHFMTEKGELIQRVILHRPLRREYHDLASLDETAWEECGEAEFRRLWQSESEDSASRLHTETIHLATGLLLPIWSSLPRDYLEVNRIVDQEGRSWLGRIVHDPDVPGLLKTFGMTNTVQLSEAAIVKALRENRSVAIDHPFEAMFKRSRVAGESRIELSGAPIDQLEWLKSLGCFTEIISYRTRIFIPANEPEPVIRAILAAY